MFRKRNVKYASQVKRTSCVKCAFGTICGTLNFTAPKAHKTRGEMLKAYIVVKDGAKLSTAELAKFCREKLASYKVPRVFEFRDELPKTLVGKVLRRALREEEEKKLAAELEAEKQTESKSE